MIKRCWICKKLIWPWEKKVIPRTHLGCWIKYAQQAFNRGSNASKRIKTKFINHYYGDILPTGEETMPLTKKGGKIKEAMKKEYGKEKGEQVFYASQNKGVIKGTHKGKKK